MSRRASPRHPECRFAPASWASVLGLNVAAGDCLPRAGLADGFGVEV